MRVSGCVLTAVLALTLCGTSWDNKRDDESYRIKVGLGPMVRQ